MMICNKCGTENETGKFCTECGAALAEDVTPQSAPQPAPQPAPVYVNVTAPEKPEIPPRYRPLSGWAYFGLQLLFAIPVVGWVFCIVFACGGCRNINKRNFARSYFCALLVAAILAVILVVLSFTGIVALDQLT